MMKHTIYNKNGFTLIEIIATLLIASIMGTIAGLGIVQIVNGYLFARESAEIVQKTQLGMGRIIKELSHENTVITIGNATSVTFSNSIGKTISLNGGALCINIGTGDDILIDAATLNSFTLSYLNSYDQALPYPATYSANTTMIQIDLILNGPDNTPITFTDRVYLRN